jgi:membrane AbrB-like protein
MIKNVKIMLKTLIIGLLGGVCFNLLLLPLPWMLGPAFFVAIFALCGTHVQIHPNLRNPFVGIIGVWLGSYFSSSLFLDAYNWFPSIIMLIVFIPSVHFITYLTLHKVRAMNKPDAFFTGSPGGTLEMILGAEECGADVKQVALAHMIRIFLTVMIVPNLILFFFPDSFTRFAVWPDLSGSYIDLLIMFIIIPIGIFLGKHLKIPGYRMFGPLICSAILHVSGLVTLDLPISSLIIAQIITGSYFGSNMNGISWNVAKNYFTNAIIALTCLGVLMLPFVFIISFITSIRPEALILAYSPGGVNEMGLVAALLQIEPAYVITHHLFRLILVLIILSLAKKYFYPKFKLLLKIKN